MATAMAQNLKGGILKIHLDAHIIMYDRIESSHLPPICIAGQSATSRPMSLSRADCLSVPAIRFPMTMAISNPLIQTRKFLPRHLSCKFKYHYVSMASPQLLSGWGQFNMPFLLPTRCSGRESIRIVAHFIGRMIARIGWYRSHKRL
jgi:hypothetical protein